MMDIDTDSKTRSKSKKKQQKTSGTNQFKTKAEDFKQPKSSKKLLQESREDRLNRSSQLRKNKITDYIMKKRGLIDSDASDSSLNLSSSRLISSKANFSQTNLTGLIDTTAYKIPPKLCAIIALNEDANLDSIFNNFEEVLKEEHINANANANDSSTFNRVNEYIWTSLVPLSIFKGKERVTMIKTERNVYSILDTCKVADMILFVTSCKKTEYSKWKTDPDKYSHAIDEFGYKILSSLRAQGLPQHVCILQDYDLIPAKHRTDVKKLFIRYFESELKPDKIFNLASCEGGDSEVTGGKANINLAKDEYKAIIRLLSSVAPFSVSLDIRKHRSYMLCEKINLLNASEMELSGYIRGNTLNILNHIHLTGFGDFLVTNVEFAADPCPVSSNSQTKTRTSSGMEVESSLHIKENKTPSLDDKVEAERTGSNLNDNAPQVIGIGGVANSSNKNKTNQAEDDDDLGLNFDNIMNEDEDDLSFDEHEEIDEEGRISNKHVTKTTLKYRTEDEMEFPDEVDTPIDFPARERFRKYRGLASLKKGTWDHLESLPKEYSNIFSFENLRHLYKLAVRKAHEEGMKISGSYVKISIKAFSPEGLNFMRKDVPLILSTLLEHERKLCVMHYKISLNYEYSERVYPKQAMETQCGFRRIITRPIYSSDVGGGVTDKLKIDKKLEKDKFYTASVYSQMTYSSSPVIFFRPDVNDLNMVASGEVVDTDSNKIILKRIILTGYPLKIKKKKAVIRYMFFTPNDVNYFKPVQLVTKNGLRGHITESLGTHGHMKCIFNDFMKASDTVCLNLYKRVFPKWFKESWKYKVYYGNRTDYKNYFVEEKKEKELVLPGLPANSEEKSSSILMSLD